MTGESRGAASFRRETWRTAQTLAVVASALCAAGLIPALLGTIFAASDTRAYGTTEWDAVVLLLGLGVVAVLFVGMLMCVIAAAACRAAAENAR